jgi:hypothetical protein
MLKPKLTRRATDPQNPEMPKGEGKTKAIVWLIAYHWWKILIIIGAITLASIIILGDGGFVPDPTKPGETIFVWKKTAWKKLNIGKDGLIIQSQDIKKPTK